jgi:vesicle coat complex subunit
MAPRRRGARSKGEVNEITRTLEQLSALDGRKSEVVHLKRECFQKLIKYMTTGIDMSSVFVPATKCVALSKHDLPLKKMLYLYLRTAARQNSSVSLLVVQTLLNDTNDVDPRIRGLAVRSMCSLRVPELLENVLPVVSEGLKDKDAYVREVSVIGVIKCYHQDSDKTVALGLVDEVKAMLRSDRDTQVITSCLYVLQQLGALNSSTLTKSLMISLMNNIRSFSEWGQCLVIDILLKYYRPETESERFDVLEVLDFGLNHTNSAVILAAAKLFLHYTSNYKEQYDQVIRLILGPLRTLLVGREPELAFAALSNVYILAQRHPEPFYCMASDFFYRPEDPSYFKLLKLDMLVALSHSGNAFDVAEESFEYARDADDGVAQHAIRSISRIAIQVGSVDGILDRLLLFLNHRRHVIVGETVVAFAAALNKFPDAATICVPSISRIKFEVLNTSEARSSFIWILGRFGDEVQDAPYILENLCEGFDKSENSVKLSILTSVVSLFCKRPAECLSLARKILSESLRDADYTLSERAGVYAKLLNTLGINETMLVVQLPPIFSGQNHVSDLSEEIQDKLFDEWNSLSVVYGAPAITFIEDAEQELSRFESGSLGGDIAADDMGMESLIDTQDPINDSEESSSNYQRTLVDLNDLLSEAPAVMETAGDADFSFDMLGAANLPEQEHITNIASKTTHIDSGDNLASKDDIFDLDMLMGSTSPVEQVDTSISTRQPSVIMQGIEALKMSQDEFKNLWSELGIFSSTFQYTFEDSNAMHAVSGEGFSNFENHIQQANLKCLGKPMKSSGQPYRFFFYGRSTGGDFVLLNITMSGQTASIDVRTESIELATLVKESLTTLLLTF